MTGFVRIELIRPSDTTEKEVDSDGDEIPSDDETKEYDGYRIWYSLGINVTPPPPERTLAIGCACQQKAVLQVVVRNPPPVEITLDAKVIGRDLSGMESITLSAGETDECLLTFAPAVVGNRKGRKISSSNVSNDTQICGMKGTTVNRQ